MEHNTKEIISLLEPGMKEIARENNGFVFCHAGKIYGVPEIAVNEISQISLIKLFKNDQYGAIDLLIADAVAKR